VKSARTGQRPPPKLHVAVRLSPEDVAKIDALMPKLGEEWMRISRSDVLRMLLHRGIEVVEREMAEKDDTGGEK